MSSSNMPTKPNTPLPDRIPRPSETEIPRDQDAVKRAASPVATLSSHVDPWPHYIMSGACAGAGLYSYNTMRNPRVAGFAGLFSLSYLFAGRLVITGYPQLGYDIGTLTSAGLLATAIPAARATGDAYSVAMSALGGISAAANLIKSYQQRTGLPKEMHETRHNMPTKPNTPLPDRIPRPSETEIPRDQDAVKRAASPVATLSSHVDPWPHYIMSGACAGAGLYSYNTMRNPRVAGFAGLFSLSYLFAG
ncbi:hypothetical protein HYH03_012769 [Edaphochlamys debaryana]|nr:hypothetical protein HYH03_012769 [Edaphochlamys debaryana]|eukprot:KAG2488772.1 hypothetical protein HYH03_012769 [Edaphochlamys debaryana]